MPVADRPLECGGLRFPGASLGAGTEPHVGGAPASDRPSVELRSLEAADTGLPEDANRPPFPYESSGQLLQTNTMYRP